MKKPEIKYVDVPFSMWDEETQAVYSESEMEAYIIHLNAIIARRDKKILALNKELKKFRGAEHRTKNALKNL